MTYTLEQVRDACMLNGIPESQAESYYHNYNRQGWKRGNGQEITNLRSHMWRLWRADRGCWAIDLRDKEDKPRKTKLFPIPGKTCSKSGCPMPAVYKSTSGAADHYYCQGHLPAKVREKYE